MFLVDYTFTPKLQFAEIPEDKSAKLRKPGENRVIDPSSKMVDIFLCGTGGIFWGHFVLIHCIFSQRCSQDFLQRAQ